MARDPTRLGLAISGATGAVGGRIVSRLAGLGHCQRLIVRDTKRAPDLPEVGVAEASYEDPRTLRDALAGTRTFFMVSAGETADRGILPGPANLTVERYLTSWLVDSVQGTVSRATYDGYRRDVHHYIIPELGRRKLKELTPGDIRRLYRKMAEKGLKDRSIEYVHTTLRKSLKTAVVDRLINHNPTDGVKPIKTPSGAAKESKALDPQQVKTLLDAASGSRFEALYAVAIHTGLRRGELLGLTWTDADLEAGTLMVRRSLDVDGTFKSPKNRAAMRALKLTHQALDALKVHKVRQNAERLQAGRRWRDHDLVFPNTVGKPMNAGNLYRREFQPLLKRAGLADEGFTIHSLRHTFATTLAEKGVHPSTAQKMLGHSDIRMTLAIYTHATDGMQDAATKALEKAFS